MLFVLFTRTVQQSVGAAGWRGPGKQRREQSKGTSRGGMEGAGEPACSNRRASVGGPEEALAQPAVPTTQPSLQAGQPARPATSSRPPSRHVIPIPLTLPSPAAGPPHLWKR